MSVYPLKYDLLHTESQLPPNTKLNMIDKILIAIVNSKCNSAFWIVGLK